MEVVTKKKSPDEGGLIQKGIKLVKGIKDFLPQDFQILKGERIFPSWRYIKKGYVKVKGSVCMCLYDAVTGDLKLVDATENIVTDAGDLYYAQRAALLTVGATIAPLPDNFTNANGVPDMVMEMYDNTGGVPGKSSNRSSAGTQIGSAKAMDSGYPKPNDDDGDNTGAGTDIVTYRVSFTTAEVNGSIDEVILTNPTPGASEAVIQFADGLAVTKTSSDTLKVFVNHTFNGV